MSKNISTLTIDNTSYTVRPYGICNTSSSLINKTVQINGFNLYDGATICVNFKNGNNTLNNHQFTPTLDVNGIGAKPIKGTRLFTPGVYEFIYDKTEDCWNLIHSDGSNKVYYCLDLTDLDGNIFYPVVFKPDNFITDCEIHSSMHGGNEEANNTDPLNQNAIHFQLRAQGWTDAPKSFKILSYGRYYGSKGYEEITIGAIGYGTNDGEQCVWIRGGRKYSFLCNKYPILCTTQVGNDADIVYGTSNNGSKPKERISKGKSFAGNPDKNENIHICWSPPNDLTAQSDYNTKIYGVVLGDESGDSLISGGAKCNTKVNGNVKVNGTLDVSNITTFNGTVTCNNLLTLAGNTHNNTIKWANKDFPAATAQAFIGKSGDWIVRSTYDDDKKTADLRFNGRTVTKKNGEDVITPIPYLKLQANGSYGYDYNVLHNGYVATSTDVNNVFNDVYDTTTYKYTDLNALHTFLNKLKNGSYKASTNSYGAIKVYGNTNKNINNPAGLVPEKYYGIELNSDGGAVVNVPWIDTTNTTCSLPTTSKIYLVGGTSQSESIQTYSNGSVYVEDKILSADKISVNTGLSIGTNSEGKALTPEDNTLSLGTNCQLKVGDCITVDNSYLTINNGKTLKSLGAAITNGITNTNGIITDSLKIQNDNKEVVTINKDGITAPIITAPILNSTLISAKGLAIDNDTLEEKKLTIGATTNVIYGNKDIIIGKYSYSDSDVYKDANGDTQVKYTPKDYTGLELGTNLTLLLQGTEHCAIKSVNNSSGSITTNNPVSASSNIAIKKALDFEWYEDHYQIGNIRGNAHASIGFGITKDNDKLVFRAKYDTSDTTAGGAIAWIGTQKILHEGNYKIYEDPKYALKTDITNMNKESYLTWGDKALAYNISPIDVCLSNTLSANRLSFMDPDDIKVEYTNDNGQTWVDSGVSAATKTNLVTTGLGTNLYMGGKNTKQTPKDQLRITIRAITSKLYFSLKKILLNISTGGASGTKVTVEKCMYSTDNIVFTAGTWETVGTFNLVGEAGWNSIPMNQAFGGKFTSHICMLRFTFNFTKVAAGRDEDNIRFNVLNISMHGENLWAVKNSLATHGNIYSYDKDKITTFPNTIKVTSGGSDRIVLHEGNCTNYTVGTAYNANKLTNTDSTLLSKGSATTPVYFTGGEPKQVTSIDNSLINTSGGTSTLVWNSEVTLGTIAGQAIKAKLPAKPTTDLSNYYNKTEVGNQITNAIGKLDKTDTAVPGKYVSSVTQENGIITVTRAILPESGATLKCEKNTSSAFNGNLKPNKIIELTDTSLTSVTIAGFEQPTTTTQVTEYGIIFNAKSTTFSWTPDIKWANGVTPCSKGSKLTSGLWEIFITYMPNLNVYTATFSRYS